MPEDLRMKEIEKMKQEKKNNEFFEYLADSTFFKKLGLFWGM